MAHTVSDTFDCIKCYVTLLLRYLGTEAYAIIANYKETQVGFPTLLINQIAVFQQMRL